MKKYILFLFYIGSTSVLISGEIIVCKTCDITSIKHAVKAAQSGDTITVKDGIYNETDIVIDKPLTVKGQNVIIDAGFKGGIFEIIADSISISGFTLNNTGMSYTKDIAAVYCYRTNNFKFENLIINNSQFAILVHKSKNGIIRKNTIVGNAETEAGGGNGIHLWHSNNIEIADNTITGMRDGIYFEFVDNSVILNNRSTDNLRYGLHFMFSNYNTYQNNSFENNGAGVAVMFSKFITMENNLFKHNWGTAAYGLLLKEIYDGEISGNQFIQNTTGINVEGSTRINYHNNTFDNNGWGVKIAGGCYDNNFTLNDFINNSFDVSYYGGMNNNTFYQNYWSEYAGYDLNYDGFGDITYRPVKLFSYVVGKTPEAIILMRSLFVDIINFSEKVTPVFTPDQIQDDTPVIDIINRSDYK